MAWQIFGSLSCSMDGILKGMARMTVESDPRWKKTLPRKRERPSMPNEKSTSNSISSFFCCLSVRMLYASDLHCSGVSVSYFSGYDLLIDADARRAVHREVQIAATRFNQIAQQHTNVQGHGELLSRLWRSYAAEAESS